MTHDGGGSTYTLSAGGCRAVFDLAVGARLASLVVDGNELLVEADDDPMQWGSYPMVPWAGRVRHGRFSFEGVDHQLPITLGPHAIHGTAYTSTWTEQDGVMSLRLTEPWPFGGRVEQRAELTATSLSVSLRIDAGASAMPAMLGWHPWFRRFIGGAEAELELDACMMYELDDEMIPTGSRIGPKPPPWDHCFELGANPVIRWPGVIDLELRSDCRFWTVYTEPEHALCVEPQTSIPNSFNRRPDVLAPGESLSARFDLAWAQPAP